MNVFSIPLDGLQGKISKATRKLSNANFVEVTRATETAQEQPVMCFGFWSEVRTRTKTKRTSMWRPLLFSALANYLFTHSLVHGLSSPGARPEIEYRQFIQLTNPINTRIQQSIPVSFVRDWPTWVLDEDGILSKIPDDDGFVPPTSVDEVWHPVDLKRPGLKLALGLHVREGVIRHVMPAVDLSFDGGVHRNRGVCSVPRAHSWIDFSLSLDEWENYKIILSSKEEKDGDSWKEIESSKPGDIAGAIERASRCLSESAPGDLGTGSHIMNVVFDDRKKALECPKNEMRVAMIDDYDFLENADDASGALEVVISSIMAGSESEYLPEAYKPLYDDESFRNPLYEKFKQGQKERGGKKPGTSSSSVITSNKQ